MLKILKDIISLLRQHLPLALFRQKMWQEIPGATVRCANYTVKITDGPNFYMQYKDEFINRIYDFRAQRPDPYIVDCGSNMGLSILYFKQMYPKATIIGFEPDPAIFQLLTQNLKSNGITDVRIVNAGLGAEDGESPFIPDGESGGHPAESGPLRVKMERLSHYLVQPVDFLKMNIEGAELDVLVEVANSGRLQNVRELVLEYHGWPNEHQKLGPILTLLDNQGFRYLVHDFDAQTSPVSKPPFRLHSHVTWFCLVYARNMKVKPWSEE